MGRRFGSCFRSVFNTFHCPVISDLLVTLRVHFFLRVRSCGLGGSSSFTLLLFVLCLSFLLSLLLRETFFLQLTFALLPGLFGGFYVLFFPDFLGFHRWWH